MPGTEEHGGVYLDEITCQPLGPETVCSMTWKLRVGMDFASGFWVANGVPTAATPPATM
ncbi:MAG: hypothetical protein ACRDTH_23115 [Pseudonocardiaceae bacterium]